MMPFEVEEEKIPSMMISTEFYVRLTVREKGEGFETCKIEVFGYLKNLGSSVLGK